MTKQDQRRAEVAVVLQLLRDDRAECWSVAELEDELEHLVPLVLRHTLGELANYDVVVIQGRKWRASRCAQHLDRSGFVMV